MKMDRFFSEVRSVVSVPYVGLRSVLLPVAVTNVWTRTRPSPSKRSVVAHSITGSAPVPADAGQTGGRDRVPVDPLVFPHLFLQKSGAELLIEPGPGPVRGNPPFQRSLKPNI